MQLRTFTRYSINGLLLTLLLIFGVLIVHAAPITIDIFTNNNQVIVTCDEDEPTFPQSNSGFRTTANALGGERDFFIECATGTSFGSADLTTSSVGSLSFNQGSGIQTVGRVAWDGTDNDGVNLDPEGLCVSSDCTSNPGPDLTDSNSNVAIHLNVIDSDQGLPVTVRVYSDGTDHSEYTVDVPGDILGGSSVSFLFPFTDFTTSGGSGADFSNVGAITLVFDGSNDPNADIAVNLLEATDNTHDFGDAPASYEGGVPDPARHLLDTGLRLGPSLSAEATKRGTTAANDTFDDGVTRTSLWVAGNSATLGITVRGCATTCQLNGWIDWDENGDFTTSGDQIFTDSSVSNATTSLNFTVPSTVTVANNSFYARFRLCSTGGDCDTPTGESADGEVEDYLWGFGPTAITLQNATAENPQNNMVLALVLGMVGLGVTSLILHKKQRATGN